MSKMLTVKERALLEGIREGMDEPGCGWLWEVTPFADDRTTNGVLGSLVKKGLVTASYEDGCSWVQLKEEV